VDAPGFQLRDVPVSDPFETIRKGLRLLSPKVGIIRELGGGVHFTGDPECFVIGNHVCDPSRFTKQPYHKDRSGSAGLAIEHALAAAIGEAVERYCMRFYWDDELVLGTYRELSRTYDLVHPRATRLHTQEQIDARAKTAIGGVARQVVLDDDVPIRWTWGYSLTDQKPKLVPAHMVYLPYRTLKGEARVGWNSSTGLAAGNTLEEAILSGICEWVERDAFVICWLNRGVPRRIEVDDSVVKQLLEERFQVDDPHVDLRIFDTTLDIQIPSILVWMRRPMDFGLGCFVGAACRTTPRGACTKALVELAQCVPYGRLSLQQYENWVPKEDFTDIWSFDRHSIFYMKRPDLIEESFRFLAEAKIEGKLSDLPDLSTGNVRADVDKTVVELARHGYETLVVDLTTPDVQEAGLHAVRVLVPGLQNLHGNHNWPCLAVERTYTVPRTLGWESRGWRAEDGLNPFPHPFP
jgi:ribosomal protein S12 methylthiotransferase accessory factor